MGCTGTPTLGSPNCLGCSKTTFTAGDGRSTVNGATRAYAQRFQASQRCISSIMLKSLANYGADLQIEIREDMSHFSGPVPKGAPGSPDGLAAGPVIFPASQIPSSGWFEIAFDPPLQLPSSGWYHIVLSSSGKCFTEDAHDIATSPGGIGDGNYTTAIYPVLGAMPNGWMNQRDVAFFAVYFKDYSPTGTLSVTSNPSGAEIFINEIDQGRTTPDSIDLNVGTYTLTLKLSGYCDYTTSVSITAGTTKSVTHDMSYLTCGLNLI